mgnify:FL=1
MLGWLKVLRKKFQKMNPVVQVAIAIIAILVVRYLVNTLIYSNFASGMFESFGNPKELVYFHMNQCGHCKKFTPEWEKFVQGYNGNLKLRKVERSEAGDELNKYQIQGFPTILLLDGNGGKKEFDGPRTVNGLEQFTS